MSKFIIILALAITSIELSFSSTPVTLSDNEVAILNSKRHNLIKLAFSELRKAILQDETFDLAAEFLRDIKLWSNTVGDENLKKSEFNTQVDMCLHRLNALRADRGNCEIHTNFIQNYVEIRGLTRKVDNDFRDLQNAFTSKLEKIIKKQRDQLYEKLMDEMELFIKDLNDEQKSHAHDLIEWYDKFNSEKDILVKQHMAMDFPRLFSKEQLNANTTCMPNSITDGIK